MKLATAFSSPAANGTVPMRKRFRREVARVVDAWLLWTTLGALGGVLMLSPSLQNQQALPAPSATEIERAVALAEAEGIAAGARIKAGGDYR